MKTKKTPIQNCHYCNVPMERKRFNERLEDMTSFRKRKFCNQICMAKGMIQEHVTLASLRKRAEKFRGNFCQTCKTKTSLHVHHIDSNPENNISENLMTLCASCHVKWHYAHGKSNRKTPKKCAYCDKPSRKKGLCNTHASRMWRHGDPLIVRGIKLSQTSEELRME